MFLEYILFTHRNDYCIQMLLSGKTEVASSEKLSGHNQSRFRILEYDRIPAPGSIFYSELHGCVVVSVQYNGGFLPDVIILLTRCGYIGEPF